MRKRTVTIGLVVLVIGVASLIGGAIGALGSLSINNAFTQPHPGEFVSSEIKLNTTSELVVSSPAAVGGIIPAQDLNLVNSTSISTQAIPISSTGAGSDIYKSISGNYYYVAFSSTQPSTTIVATAVGSSVIAYGSLVLLGLVLVVVGIVIAVIGVRQKARLPVQGQT
jgi:hypothetical protein